MMTSAGSREFPRWLAHSVGLEAFYVGAFVKSLVVGAKGCATPAGTLGRTPMDATKAPNPCGGRPDALRFESGGACGVGHTVSRTAFYPCRSRGLAGSDTWYCVRPGTTVSW